MDIYTFVTSLCDTSGMCFSLFDCNSGNVITVQTDDGEKTVLDADELLWSDYADYEIGGVDVWIDKGVRPIHFEFNIEVEEDEDGCCDDDED